MKRLTITCAVISVLLLINGIYMEAANYHPGDQNAFFGNANVILSDGQVVLISAGLFIIATVAIWVVDRRRRAAAVAAGDGAGQQERPDDRRTATRS
jgi:hypothetical protein